MRYIGLDIHQRYCEGYEIGPNNEKRRFKLPNTREAWEEFGQTLDQDTKVVMEATSNAFWVYDILSAYPAQVVIANPLKTRAIAEARVKTDALDAQILAKLLASDFISTTWVPSKEEYQLRILLHHRIRLAKIRTMLKNKIHAALTRNGFINPCSDLFGKKGRSFLESVQLPESDQIVLLSNLKLLDFVQKEIEVLEGEIHEQAKGDEKVELLMGIPGISVLSALTLLAEIGDIHRFPHPKKLSSYAGLVPSVHQSGKTRYTGHITKAGRNTLRWIVIQCAQRGVQSNGSLKQFYLRLRDKKGHKIAIVAAARKLLEIVWSVLTKKEQYRELRIDLLKRKLNAIAKKGAPYPEKQNNEYILESFKNMELQKIEDEYINFGVG